MRPCLIFTNAFPPNNLTNHRIRDPYVRWCERRTSSVDSGGAGYLISSSNYFGFLTGGGCDSLLTGGGGACFGVGVVGLGGGLGVLTGGGAGGFSINGFIVINFNSL